ncbi:hypothetical protein Tco_0003751, partial [Tanacetum coccineum]
KADDQEIENIQDEEGKNVEDQQVSEADDYTNIDDFGCLLTHHKGADLTVEEVVLGGGKVLGVGEDDDLCNAASDGGDNTVESGDISILNSLISPGSPRSLQLCGTIGTTEVLIDKEVDKEVQYDVYTLQVLIPFLKRLNDQYIKKKKMKAAM